jgi:TetR/AcrR family transcriptional regulator
MQELDQRILDAAMQEFGRKGYVAATTRNIAKEAGVNEVTLFRKFQSKENLLRAVIVRARDTALQELESIFLRNKAADLPTSLRGLGRGLMKILAERRDLMFLLISEGRRKSRVAKLLSSIPEIMLKRLGEYFEDRARRGELRNLNPQAVAMIFASYLVYNNLARALLDGKILGNEEEAFDEFVDIFAKGILRQSGDQDG